MEPNVLQTNSFPRISSMDAMITYFSPHLERGNELVGALRLVDRGTGRCFVARSGASWLLDRCSGRFLTARSCVGSSKLVADG